MADRGWQIAEAKNIDQNVKKEEGLGMKKEGQRVRDDR